MERQAFYTSRLLVGTMLALAALGTGLGVLLVAVAPTRGVAFIVLASGLFLGAVMAIEWVRPVFEIAPTQLVLRHARLRRAIVVARPVGVTLSVERGRVLGALAGLRLGAPGGERWVPGHLAELCTPDGAGIQIPIQNLSSKDRARFEEALRAWARGDGAIAA